MTANKDISTGGYAQVLRSSSIVGGAQAVNYLIAAVRVKIVALLLGPSGVGLISLYTAAIGPVQTIAGCGLDASGVRQVARSHDDTLSSCTASTVTTLRRACAVAGVIGCVATAALSKLLSNWTFGTAEHAWAFVALGSVVFFSIATGGEQAILLGSRRVGDFAKVSIISSSAGTIVVALIYLLFRAAGVVPALVAGSAIYYGSSLWFTKRIGFGHSCKPWRETFIHSKNMFVLGSAFMYRALLAAAAALIIRAFLMRLYGIEAIGYYQAAWALSVLFANFIIAAMGADFLPRLSAASDDTILCSKLINEQTEVGILLALPGILVSLVLSPILIDLFYSHRFMPAAGLLPWLTLGVFMQVVTFPTAMIQEAKGRTSTIYASQTFYHVVSLAFTFVLVRKFGLIGAAWSFTLTTLLQGALIFIIARKIAGIRWTMNTLKLAGTAIGFIFFSILVTVVTREDLRLVLQLAVMASGIIFALYSLSFRLGKGHRLSKLLAKLQFLSPM